jgi:tRNA-specific 2-thiouridylase
MSHAKPKVLVGMSGGVDSSVSAALLLEQGYEVIGGFMKNWSEDVGCGVGCTWREDRRDALKVAAHLGIPLHTFDFEKEYRAQVVDPMFAEFAAGRTPNPDVLCNKFVKFDLFLKAADRLGCDFIATGHYARIIDGKIMAGADSNKDQTYFLWAIPPAVLPRVLFPVGAMPKPEVRAKARALGLPVAEKPDSVGICFVGEVAIEKFLKTRLPEDPGQIVNVDGEVLGRHRGLAFYTIGQREGLEIAGGIPLYVVEKRPATNELIVGSAVHPALFKDTLAATNPNWFRSFAVPYRCQARIRYRQPLEPCVIESVVDGIVKVKFDRPQRAVTPGQSIVFYDGEEMLGGAIIE